MQASLATGWISRKIELVEVLGTVTFFCKCEAVQKVFQITPKALEENNCNSKKKPRAVVASGSIMLAHTSISPVKKEREADREIECRYSSSFLLLPLVSGG